MKFTFPHPNTIWRLITTYDARSNKEKNHTAFKEKRKNKEKKEE